VTSQTEQFNSASVLLNLVTLMCSERGAQSVHALPR